MENPNPEQENITKDVRNVFRLKKASNAIKDRILIRNIFRPEKENKAIKNIILRDITNHFGLEQEKISYTSKIK